jgi:hypothetical protein
MIAAFLGIAIAVLFILFVIGYMDLGKRLVAFSKEVKQALNPVNEPVLSDLPKLLTHTKSSLCHNDAGQFPTEVNMEIPFPSGEENLPVTLKICEVCFAQAHDEKDV